MRRLRRALAHPQFAVSLLLVVYVAVVTAFAPEMASMTTVREVVIAMLPLSIVVVGQCFVLMVGEIDLSVAGSMSAASIVAASVMSQTQGFLSGGAFDAAGGLAAFVAIGLAVGLANGVCVAYGRMPSFIVTLANMMFLSGTAIWYSSIYSTSVSIGDLPPAFVQIGYGGVLGVPIALLLAVVTATGAHILLKRTLLGRRMVAVGANRTAALISGVPVARVILAAFVVSGVLGGLASAILTARIEAGTPVLAQNMLLDIIGAAVIGGVSLLGGRGTIFGAAMGVLFLVVLDKGLQLVGVSLSTVLAAKGAVILIAAVLDLVRQRWAARLALGRAL